MELLESWKGNRFEDQSRKKGDKRAKDEGDEGGR